MKKISLKIIAILIIFTVISSIGSLVKAEDIPNSVERVEIRNENSSGEGIAKPGDKIDILVILTNSVHEDDNINTSIKIKIGEGEEITLNNNKITSLNTNAIEFSYIVKEGDNGILQIISKDIQTSVGTWNLPTSDDVITVDSIAPYVVSVGNLKSGEYKTGDTIQVEIVFNEEIFYTKIPELKIKIGQGTEKIMSHSERDYNKILYTYYVQEQDKGELQIIGVYGGLIVDIAENETILSKDINKTDTGMYINEKNSNTGNTNTNSTNTNSTNTPATDNKTDGNSTNQNSIKRGNDATTSNKVLPFTGNSRTIILSIVVIALISVFSYMSYKKYKEIK